jgi:hypothetical protein
MELKEFLQQFVDKTSKRSLTIVLKTHHKEQYETLMNMYSNLNMTVSEKIYTIINNKSPYVLEEKEKNL